MRRRDFIGIASGAVIGFSAHAQEPRRVVGVLGSAAWLPESPGGAAPPGTVEAFLKGLKYAGFVEGQNVRIEWRWAQGQYDRLPSLASELVSRGVSVIACLDAPSAFAAKAATGTIPIVFLTGADPVKTGLVDSFGRPNGNLTGVAVLIIALLPKQLEFLGELLPTASRIVLLANPSSPNFQTYAPEAEVASKTLRRHVQILTARTEAEIDAAFTTIHQQADALVVVADPLFFTRREQVVALAAHYVVPTIYPSRYFSDVGGLISYGTAFVPSFQQMGNYTGRILKGAKPADLPVQQSTQVELVINLKTANALGLTIPPSLLARADEVIE
jgi:putative ABC transport system substrate-binding protein